MKPADNHPSIHSPGPRTPDPESRTVTFYHPHGETTVHAPAGTTLSSLARHQNLFLNTRCGEKGACKGCAVYLKHGRFSVAGEQVEGNEEAPVFARSCQTHLLEGGGRVFIPATSLIETTGQIEESFILEERALVPAVRLREVGLEPVNPEHPAADLDRLLAALRAEEIAAPEVPLAVLRALPKAANGGRVRVALLQREGRPPRMLQVADAAAPGRALGVAIDIGTTTVVCALVDLQEGRVLRKAARYNAQIGCADDVASRISWAMSGPERLRELQELVIERTVNPLIEALCAAEGAEPSEIVHITAAGNTVMGHLFLMLPPENLGRLPFNPAANDYPAATAAELGLLAHPAAAVEIVPGISAYVGGDITADLYAARLHEELGTVLLIDIGTNGEMVLLHEGKMLATATAAGPAFEGYGIAFGCRAATGAIESIRVSPSGDVQFSTIGEAKPIGICGTGIIDFIAEGRRAGLLSETGRFNRQMLENAGNAVQYGDGGIILHACRIAGRRQSATGTEITISEADIAQILKAKAAIFAGIRVLLVEAGLELEGLEQVVLAGGFARHLCLENTIAIGLLPDVPLDRYRVVGNGSLAGACLLMLDRGAASACSEIRQRPRTVELNRSEDFNDEFVDALLLPHAEPELFPSVAQTLAQE